MSEDRAKRIFLEALELDPGARDDFVRSRTDDSATRAKVRQLLAAHNSAGRFLASPAISLGQDRESPSEDSAEHE